VGETVAAGRLGEAAGITAEETAVVGWTGEAVG
jgi:hypothetical protein